MTAEQSSKASTTSKRWLTCAGSSLVVCVLAVLILFAYSTWDTISARSSVELNIQSPSQVQLGNNFDVVLLVHNVEDSPITIVGIAIDNSLDLNLLSGVELVSVAPSYSSYQESFDSHFYSFDTLVLAPDQSQTITVTFRAFQEGTFEGFVFVDVNKNDKRFHTKPESLHITVAP